MKVLNRQDFMKMPEGTIFAKGKRWYFEQLSFKAGTMSDDFVCLDLCNVDNDSFEQLIDRLEEMLSKGTSYPFDNTGFSRDGCFDEDDLFLVFEKDDLLILRSRIDEALTVLSP